jgi:formylglycine-generating enzyme required for sulfatase activity
VLSDCAGSYWWDGTLLPMLQDWAKIMPTVVWQMLPEWMWERTALGRGAAVALSNDRPGAANQRLTVRLLEQDEPEETAQRLSVPVVTSEVRDLTNWSLMLAGDRREVTPGFLLPQPGGAVPKARAIEDMARDRVAQNADSANDETLKAALAEAIQSIARDRVQRFRALSSPQARRLVMLLAAAPVITLPVMRLIRDSMHEAKSPLPVAEVFLSGLLERLPDQADAEPSLVQYDFVPNVREVLLDVLPAVDTIEVINRVSAAVEERWHQFSPHQDFRAFLLDPTVAAPEELEGLRSFASVTAAILETLKGEEYANMAQRLRHGAGEAPPPFEPGRDDFPPLEPFAFTEAQLVDDEAPIFPPPLQTDTFTVITFEAGLEPFAFTVARLVNQPASGFNFRRLLPRALGRPIEWVIQRQQQSASRLVEALADDLPLELVSIPAGSFLMGSPEAEPGRSGSESPQHEVTIAAFLLGRYPITQAQWRVVALLPQIKQALNPEPSQFKSDDRPVENVSWEAAVEFCARLSRLMERPYRLPTEAEWEYACRAGTTTPFHFGDMITTDVANYDGSAYVEGPVGKSRSGTTPVDSFGIANAFGLSDMHGNVWEWCEDQWHDSYGGAPSDGSAWLTDDERARRILRGGSWDHYPWYCRSACRSHYDPDIRNDNAGFRVCCSAPRTL